MPLGSGVSQLPRDISHLMVSRQDPAPRDTACRTRLVIQRKGRNLSKRLDHENRHLAESAAESTALSVGSGTSEAQSDSHSSDQSCCLLAERDPQKKHFDA